LRVGWCVETVNGEKVNPRGKQRKTSCVLVASIEIKIAWEVSSSTQRREKKIPAKEGEETGPKRKKTCAQRVLEDGV